MYSLKESLFISVLSIAMIIGLFSNSLITNAAGTNLTNAESINLGETKSGIVYGTYKENGNAYYKFSIASLKTIKITTTWHCNYVDVMTIYLYDSLGNELQKETTSQGNTLGFVTDEYFYTLSRGNYYIVLEYGYNTNDGKEYDLNISEYSTDILYNFAGNSFDNAPLLALNQKAKALIYGTYRDNCTQYYKFTLSRDMTLSIKTKLDNIGVDGLTINIYNAQKNSIINYLTEYEKNPYEYRIFLSKGDYYISLQYGYNTGSGKWYDLILSEYTATTNNTSNSNTSSSEKKKQPTLNKKTITIKKGKKVKLKVAYTYGEKIKWKSANTKIASVSKMGVVKGKKKGKTIITATVRGKKLKCKITVRNTSSSEKKKQPKFNKKTVTIKKGKNVKLKIAYTYKKKIKWKSANTKIASVSKTGVVKGKKKGKTIITATVRGKKLKCKITVRKY